MGSSGRGAKPRTPRISSQAAVMKMMACRVSLDYCIENRTRTYGPDTQRRVFDGVRKEDVVCRPFL
jgi:hypothetical protein